MSEMLFDVSPDEVPEGRRKTQRRAAELPASAEPTIVSPPPRRERAVRPIGQIDGEPCEAPLCWGITLWDILWEDSGEWMVSCWACGACKWMPVVPGHLSAQATFTMRDGRFKGLTFVEIADEPRGMDTIIVYAQIHKDDKVREAAKNFLDGRNAARYPTPQGIGGRGK